MHRPVRVLAARVLLQAAKEVGGEVLKDRAVERVVLRHALDDHGTGVHERAEERMVSVGAAGHEVGVGEAADARVLGSPEVERLGGGRRRVALAVEELEPLVPGVRGWLVDGCG